MLLLELHPIINTLIPLAISCLAVAIWRKLGKPSVLFLLPSMLYWSGLYMYFLYLDIGPGYPPGKLQFHFRWLLTGVGISIMLFLVFEIINTIKEQRELDSWK